MSNIELKKTKCSCGRDIYYKTKAPKKCDVCKKSGSTGRRKKRSYGSSDGELKMFFILNDLISSEYVNNGYYSWLPSPKNVPMQLDRYYPELKLAWEYDGRQHHEYNSYFHKTKQQFEYLQKCDVLKSKLCAESGVTLIRIRYDKKLTHEYILSRIRDTNPKLFNSLVKKDILNLTYLKSSGIL